MPAVAKPMRPMLDEQWAAFLVDHDVLPRREGMERRWCTTCKELRWFTIRWPSESHPENFGGNAEGTAPTRTAPSLADHHGSRRGESPPG